MAIVISGVNNNDKITSSDGTIDLLSGVNYVGVITAPAIQSSGNITASGNVSGVNITSSNNLTAANINVGSNIQFGNAGIITATTLIGNVTGNVNHTSNLLLQISGSEKLRIANSGAFGLNGTNYGSSGQVLTSQGSGSSPTWSTVSGTTINNNADNRIITGSGTANTLNAETNVVIDSSGRLLLGHSSSRQIGGHTALYQQEGTSFSNATLAITANSADGNGSYLILGNQRSGSTGGNTIVQSGDEVGTIRFAASDGTDMNTPAAQIRCNVDGTPGSNDMPGRLVFSTTADGSAAPSERMKIDSAGNVTITNGNLVIGTAGKGIDFSATSDATHTAVTSGAQPSTDSEVLTDYEHGTWTPRLRAYDHAGGAGWNTMKYTDGTEVTGTGRYVRMGNHVWAGFKFESGSKVFDSSWTYWSIDSTPYGANHYDKASGSLYVSQTNFFTDSNSHIGGFVHGNESYMVVNKPNGHSNATINTSNNNRYCYGHISIYTSRT